MGGITRRRVAGAKVQRDKRTGGRRTRGRAARWFCIAEAHFVSCGLVSVSLSHMIHLLLSTSGRYSFFHFVPTPVLHGTSAEKCETIADHPDPSSPRQDKNSSLSDRVIYSQSLLTSSQTSLHQRTVIRASRLLWSWRNAGHECTMYLFPATTPRSKCSYSRR